MTENIACIVYLIAIHIVSAEWNIYYVDSPTQSIGGRIYKKELLTDQFASPKELAYDSSSRNLFFMYMDDELQNSGRGYVNVITKTAKKIHGIEKNKAVAVDSESGDVYFGSEDGLYKYDPIRKTADNVALFNMNIMKLVIRNNGMYLLDGNDHSIYKVYNEGNTAVKISSSKTIMEFDVDYKNNVHFVSMCGLYCLVRGHELIQNEDLSLVYNFIVSEDKTFGLADDGVYELQCENGTASKVTTLDFSPKSIVFGDYGDIYYTEDDSVYKLKPITSYMLHTLRKKP